MILQSKTKLAWSFNEVLTGTFKRNKVDFAHHDYPIIGPLPTNNKNTQPIEPTNNLGPFIYFIVDNNKHVQYVGKSEEVNVLKRWMRPGVGGPSDYYWTHSTKAGGCVFNIAKGIALGNGPYHLHYATLGDLLTEYGDIFGIDTSKGTSKALKQMEDKLKYFYVSNWNVM